MTKVIEIGAREYLAGRESKGVALSLSTYDIPLVATSEYDKASGLLSIDFRYVDAEETEPHALNEQLTVKLGKHSGKIRGLVIAVDKFKISEVLISVTDALKAQIPSLKKFNQRANYDVISSVLTKKKNELAEAMAY